MPKERDFKKLVRARMAKTGESYAAARRQLLARQGEESRQDGPAVFSEATARILPMAGDEARVRGHAVLEPEHVLLGILDEGGPAAQLLLSLKVSPAAVRSLVERGLPAPGATGTSPTMSERVKDLLAAAADEAADLGEESVTSIAVLLAVAAADDVAARALAEYGASEQRLRRALAGEEESVAELTSRVTDVVQRTLTELLRIDVELGDSLLTRIDVSRRARSIAIEIESNLAERLIGRRGETANRLRDRCAEVLGEPIVINFSVSRR